jgi:hypothetical protein
MGFFGLLSIAFVLLVIVFAIQDFAERIAENRKRAGMTPAQREAHDKLRTIVASSR